jgi:glucose-1-phosphate thymidylyltransferase
MDTGTPQSYLECNRQVLNDQSPNTPPSSHIGNGTVIQPSRIGDNVLIEDAEVGPYVSISDGVQIVGVNVRDSIVLANSRIAGTGTVFDSIVGKNCVLQLSDEKSSYSFILGDDCSLSGEQS